MIKLKIYILSFLLMSLVLGGEIKINSNPEEADIFIRSGSDGEAQRIGKTPYKTNLDELIKTYVKTNSFYITIKKQGFNDFNTLYAKTSSLDIDMNVKLKVNEEIAKIKEYDNLMAKLFDAQKIARSGNYSGALKILDELEAKYRDFSIISELKGIVYYMRKDVEKSLSYFRKAFATNPDNIDAYKMKVYLEKKLRIYSDL